MQIFRWIMKETIKNIIKSITFVVILLILFEGISYILLPQKKNISKFGMGKTSQYAILGEEENTIDVVYIGDSLVYSSVSPMLIWHNYGYTGFDCASAARLLSDAYDDLEIAVASQHPKVVFLEADTIFRNPKNKPWYYDYKKDFEQYAPLFNYHDNWKKYIFNIDKKNFKFSKLNFYKGFKFIDKTVPTKAKNYMKITDKSREIPIRNLEIFRKFVLLCKKNNIKLVLFSVPNMGTWSYAKHLSTDNLAKEYNLEFIDLNIDNPLKIDWKTETRDGGRHLNYLGAIKVSDFIGDYLKNSGLVVDHRPDKGYDSWHQAYNFYTRSLEKNKLDKMRK